MTYIGDDEHCLLSETIITQVNNNFLLAGNESERYHKHTCHNKEFLLKQ